MNDLLRICDLAALQEGMTSLKMSFPPVAVYIPAETTRADVDRIKAFWNEAVIPWMEFRVTEKTDGQTDE